MVLFLLLVALLFPLASPFVLVRIDTTPIPEPFHPVSTTPFSNQPLPWRPFTLFTPLCSTIDDPIDHEKLAKERVKVTKFANKYLKNTGTYVAKDPSVAASVVEGLAKHKVELGKPLW